MEDALFQFSAIYGPGLILASIVMSVIAAVVVLFTSDL
jgi:uncharacterized membrane protein YeaQ/YmgE (transglycosylase-associated protein family)